MGRSLRLSWVALAIALCFASGVARAQVLDQSQDVVDDVFPITNDFSPWQTFTAGRTGLLTSVELQLVLVCVGSCSGGNPLVVEIVAVAGGVPTATPLATALVLASAGSTDLPEWLTVPLASDGLTVAAGTAYAIHLSSGVPGTNQYQWRWGFGDPGGYTGGEFFTDTDAANGLDDPNTVNVAGVDAAFRTIVLDQVCGDGTEQAPEECDDGNTVSGDGCSADCVVEVCGDGIVNDGEACDDAGTVSGDGCSAVCTLEAPAAACRAAIAKGGSGYATARLAALAKCRNLLAAGKPLSVVDPAQCASETAAAKKIAKAAAQARKALAGGGKPKCTDALVAPLPACGESVDALVAPDAASGCLLSTNAAAVDELLGQYGY
jgi:cysteine-rich repeat protein